MVRVVVVHGDPADHALEFESAPHPGVGGQPVGHHLRVDAEFDAGGERGDGVEQHVVTRHRERQLDLAAIGQHHQRAAARPVIDQPDRRRTRRGRT